VGGRHLGVVVGSSRCGEVILGGVVLGAWSNRSKRGFGPREAGAGCPWRLSGGGYGGGRSGTGVVKWWRRKKKGCSMVGGAPFIAARGSG
jgi:hypothetical protein